MTYEEFLEAKKRVYLGDGIALKARPPAMLYAWQAAILKWALRKGRTAIFADCGLGKTFMQVAWADALNVPTLILAPLCVAEQTVAEAAKLGIAVHYAHDQSEVDGHRIVITNYERLEKFTSATFEAVVLDESSILKAFNGKTRTKLIDAFGHCRYRLCCTATPSPNDISEMANHAEFLGLMTRPEFLATWFVHDDTGWRMKRHAVEPFYRWMASWAIAIRHPSDLGYPDDGFALKPLHIRDRFVESGTISGTLFPELGVKGIQGRLGARRGSLDARVDAASDLVARDDQWILWCGLNEESSALARVIPDAIEVTGNDSYSEKVGAVKAFLSGDARVLVSKIRILGYGLNFQNCHQMAFVGIGDSYESYYQAIRRCWRYGQAHDVDAWVIVSDAERVVVENVRKKEQRHATLASRLIQNMAEFEREELWNATTAA